MRIGLMNDPQLNPLDEVCYAAAHGFDFLDLTLEPPGADPATLDGRALAAAITAAGLAVVGHTAWYLPFGLPVARLRQAAVEEVAAMLPLFAACGARLVTVHPHAGLRRIEPARTVAWNAACFAELAERARPHGLRIMIENVPGLFNEVDTLQALLNAHPDLVFHLDLAHAQIGGERAAKLLSALGARLGHVHLSDNRKRSDDHLPLGAGRLPLRQLVSLLRERGYDGTITLEVFTDDRAQLLASRDRLRRWLASPTPAGS